MSIEKKLLPSISMLAAFDATARNGSFSAAARELNLTHGAISRQISALEFQLGATLVVRSARGIELTNAGKSYAIGVRAALSTLRGASLDIMTRQSGQTVALAILPTFGTRWLMPRFPGFLKKYPDISVNFVTRLARFELAEEGIDAAIHFGTPDWPGAVCTFLMRERAVPVCSPALLERVADGPGPDFSGLPLLHLESRPDAWAEWFGALGLGSPGNLGSMVFEQISILAHAAAAGLGVALLPRFLIRNELERGELVVLSGKSARSNKAYYLVIPESKADYGPVVALREWLIETIKQEKPKKGKKPKTQHGELKS